MPETGPAIKLSPEDAAIAAALDQENEQNDSSKEGSSKKEGKDKNKENTESNKGKGKKKKKGKPKHIDSSKQRVKVRKKLSDIDKWPVSQAIGSNRIEYKKLMRGELQFANKYDRDQRKARLHGELLVLLSAYKREVEKTLKQADTVGAVTPEERAAIIASTEALVKERLFEDIDTGEKKVKKPKKKKEDKRPQFFKSWDARMERLATESPTQYKVEKFVGKSAATLGAPFALGLERGYRLIAEWIPGKAHEKYDDLFKFIGDWGYKNMLFKPKWLKPRESFADEQKKSKK